MNNRFLTIALLISLLSGCGIGSFWMNGNPAVGRNITPIRDYWRLPGGTTDARIRHWIECGGAKNGGYYVSLHELEKRETKDTWGKKFDQMQICMMKIGYRYIGSCDGEIRRAYPACRIKNQEN